MPTHGSSRIHTLLLACGIAAALPIFTTHSLAAPQFPNPVYAVGSNPYGMAKADFDGDGIEDLIVSNFGNISNPGFVPGGLSLLRGLGSGTFADPTQITLSNNPAEVATGDFNRDGRPDVAVIYEQGGAFLLNQGSLHFGPETPLPTAMFAWDLQSADFNGDGVGDLVIHGNIASQHFFQALFFQTDHFVAGPTVPAGPYSTVMSANWVLKPGDFNGDGKDDLALVTSNPYLSDSVVLIYPSAGDGSFPSPLSFTVQGQTWNAFTAELNGDGRMDLVYEAYRYLPNVGGENTYTLLYGRGDGSFDPGPHYSNVGNGGLYALVAGDLNGDAVRDFIAVNAYDFTVHLGAGDGTFAPQQVNYIGNDNVKAALSDFTRDGKIDLVILANMGEAVFTFAGNGNGTFGPTPIEALQYAPIGAAGVGDFNGDGKLDLGVGRVDTSEVSVVMGHGDGTFSPESRFAGGVGPMALRVADFDADGKMDLAEAVLNWPYAAPSPIPPGTLLLSKGNGDGTFAAPVPYTLGPYPLRMSVADFNSDGVQDLAVVDMGNLGTVPPGLRIFLGNAGGLLTAFYPVTLPRYPSDLDVGDFNLDGHPDLVLTTRRDGSLSSAQILLGNGDGTFQNPTQLAQFSETDKVAVGVADLNGDGKPDLVVADSGVGFPGYAAGGVFVFLGQGDGTFIPGVTFKAGYSAYDVTLGDFNGDSIIDLFAETGNGYESFFPGLGDGSFGAQERYGLYGSPTILGSYDFNGDNLRDLIAATSMGVFIIEKQPNKTQVFDAGLHFTSSSARRRGIVEWKTDRESSLAGFNLVAMPPGGGRMQLNGALIACAECTTGAGHSYAFTLHAPAAGRSVFVEVLYRNGQSEVFGPVAVVSPHRRGSIGKP